MLVGVDAGASHCEVALGTPDRVVARARGPAAPAHPGRGTLSAQAITETVTAARKSIGTGDPIDTLVVGAAGAAADGARRELELALADLTTARRCVVTTDIAIALESAFPGKAGLVIIAGTGSIAYGRDPSGGTHRLGGRGWRFGDGGSGYALGAAAVRAVLRAADGLDPETVLIDQLPAFLRDADPGIVTSGLAGLDVTTVASFARVVAEAAATGDAVAAHLVEQGAAELVDLTRAALARIGTVPIALHGGVLSDGSAVRAAYLRHLESALPRVDWADGPVDPALGALYLATKGQAA